MERRRESMLLANISQRCCFSSEGMSQRRGAVGSAHHHSRNPRHVRREVRGKQRLGGPVPNTDLGPEFGSFFGGLPGGKRREGRSGEQSHPDVKAAS